jgi:hypothetical protein
MEKAIIQWIFIIFINSLFPIGYFIFFFILNKLFIPNLFVMTSKFDCSVQAGFKVIF